MKENLQVLPRLVIPFLSVFILTVFLVFNGTTVFASSNHHYISVSKITVPMYIVNPKSTVKSGVAPQGVVNGPCGNLTLWVYNGGGGDAVFYEAVDSSQGAILSLNYSVTWVNNTKGVGGDDIGSSYLFPSNPWTNSDVRYTEPGSVSGDLTANDTVGFGTQCSGYATDGVVVS